MAPLTKKLYIQDTTLYIGLCWCCKKIGSTDEPLQRCGGCQLVPYCSKDCQRDDRVNHKDVCKEFPVTLGKNALYTKGPWEEHIKNLLIRATDLPNADKTAIPLFMTPWACHTCNESNPKQLTTCKCGTVSYCSKKCSRTDRQHKKKCSQLRDLIKTISMNHIQLGYPYSLLYTLETTWLATRHPAFKDLKLLNVHLIMTTTMWETTGTDPEDELFLRSLWQQGFAQAFCKMNTLHLTFILQATVNPSFAVKPVVIERRQPRAECTRCDTKIPRITRYALHQMKYHMYYSSEMYTTPDVVVVYGNSKSMPRTEDELLHTEISYRNMINNPKTILILMDESEHLVEQGLNIVSSIIPTQIIKKTRPNPFKKCTADPKTANDKCYFASLKKRDPYHLTIAI